MKRILYIVILIVCSVMLLRFGGFDINSFKNEVHLRDPKTVLSPITGNLPSGGNLISNGGNGGGGYTFDPNATLKDNGGSGLFNKGDSTFDPNATLGSNNNNSENPDNNDPNNQNNPDNPNNNTPDATDPNTNNDPNNDNPASTEPAEVTTESVETTKVEETTKEEKPVETEAKKDDNKEEEPATTAKPIKYTFTINGKDVELSKDSAVSFIQWLQNNLKPSDSTNTDQSNTNSNINDTDIQSLSSSINVIQSAPKYTDYDRTAFEKPVPTYNLNGTKVNRNDYAWKTSPYLNEADFTYTCPYTGKVITDMDDKKEDHDFGNLDYDHIVPLNFAYSRGARDWTEEQKNAYAYDQFVGVDVLNSANRSKGDKGPAEWLPDINRGSYCYSFMVICQKYNLSLTEEEIKICTDEIAKAKANGEPIVFMGGSYNG